MTGKPQLTALRNLPPLAMQEYERYLPSAFDESLTIIERINKLIQYINETRGLTAGLIEKWNEVMEWVMGNGLNEAVVDKLQDWLEDGTLKKIINEEIFNDLNKEIQDLKKTFQVEFQNFKDTQNMFSLDEFPTLYSNAELADTTVIQGIRFNPKTNEIFATQVARGLPESTSQSFVISRLTITGGYKDSMILQHGGHGTSIGLENTPSGLRIWSIYDKVDSMGNWTGGHDLVSFPYLPGVTLNSRSPQITRYNKFTEYAVTPATDEKTGRIVFRITGNGPTRIEIRNIADVVNGVDKILNAFTIPESLTYLQGFALDGNYLYWFTGDTNEAEHPMKLSVLDIRNGNIVKQVRPAVDRDEHGRLENDIFEPEGIDVYTDPVTGAKSLFMAVVTDRVYRRNYKMFAYHSPNNAALFSAKRGETLQMHKLTGNQGYTKPLPFLKGALADVREPGSYYLGTGDLAGFSDLPLDVSTGWWLDVSPKASYDTMYQVMRRTSASRDNLDVFYRTIVGTNVSEWNQLGGSPKWKNVSRASGVAATDTPAAVAYGPFGQTHVVMRGGVVLSTNYSDGMTIATIPDTHRPREWSYLNGTVNDANNPSCQLVVKANGEIALRSPVANGRMIFFDGLQYFRN